MSGGPADEIDPATAAALLDRTRREVSGQLQISLPALYAAWGVAWFVGLGAMWLSVRGQSPYVGPPAWAAVLLAVLLILAAVVTAVVVGRATRGISGASEVQGRYYGWSWAIGFVMLFSIEGALAQHGAGDEAMGLIGAGGPLLVTSLLYLSGAAIWRQPSMLLLGAWLALVVSAGVWAGPVTLLLVSALGGGGAFLVAAVLTGRRSHPAPHG